MVDYKIDNHPHADLFCMVHEIDEFAEGAVLGMDAVIIAYVVAVAVVRRWIERLEPHTGNTQAG